LLEMITERPKANHWFSRVDLPLPATRQCPEGNKDEGKRMSRNQNRISKVIAAVGLLGLLVGLSAPRVSAQTNEVVAFSNAVYAGRYACTTASDDDFFTAVIKYNPNGSGAYSDGILIASLNAFAPFGTATPSASFCTYALDLAASSYSIGTDGTGFESLSWVAATTNNGACPASFIDQTSIALRNITDTTGAITRAEFATADLLGRDEPGHGFCLK
jgi:hypothetical protein